MDKYPKLFIKSGLLYILFGVLMGVLMALGWIDATTFRYVHFHANLLGFMCMTIFGVAYHILPRFNGKPLPYADWVPAQFYLMNAGIIGMIFFYMMGGYWEGGVRSFFFGLFSLVTGGSIVIFVMNIFPILADPPPVAVTPAKTPEVESGKEKTGEAKIKGNMKVATVLDTYPNIIQIFVEFGFKALANPVAKAAFAKMITVTMACKVHRVDEENFLKALNDFASGSDKTPAPPVAAPQLDVAPPSAPSAPSDPVVPSGQVTGKGITRGEKCTGDVLVGKLIETYPETKKVFEKHYGASCFSCPGQAFETIAQTVLMHNANLDEILGEINVEIEKVLSS